MYCLSSYLNGLNGFEYFESVEEIQRDKQCTMIFAF